ALSFLRIEYASPPRSSTPPPPPRPPAPAPSIAKGTPRSEGRDRRTNVISGCTDATAAPRLRNAASSSLPSAPLECTATLPFHSIVGASNRAADAMAASGTQNHTNRASTADKSVAARAPTCRANCFAFPNDAPRDRTITASIAYPACSSDRASADPRFPAPTIATRGFPAMPGSIAEAASGFFLFCFPRLTPSRTVYRGPVFTVTTDHVQEPGGVEVRRDIIRHSGSVVVLAVDDSRSTPGVLLERQYRHAAADYLWEIPAGRIDPGEKEL